MAEQQQLQKAIRWLIYIQMLEMWIYYDFRQKSSRGSTARTIQCVLGRFHKAFSQLHIHSLDCFLHLSQHFGFISGRAEQIWGEILQRWTWKTFSPSLEDKRQEIYFIHKCVKVDVTKVHDAFARRNKRWRKQDLRSSLPLTCKPDL